MPLNVLDNECPLQDIATSLLGELVASKKSERTPRVWTWCFPLLRWGNLWDEQVANWWGVGRHLTWPDGVGEARGPRGMCLASGLNSLQSCRLAGIIFRLRRKVRGAEGTEEAWLRQERAETLLWGESGSGPGSQGQTLRPLCYVK